MILVVDASAAVRMLLDDTVGGRIRGLLTEADEVLVPDLYVAEVTNVIWKYQRSGHLSEERLERALDDLLALPDHIESTFELAREVYGTAARLGHSAYDLFYLVLARRENGKLLTLDRRLERLCGEAGVGVVAV